MPDEKAMIARLEAEMHKNQSAMQREMNYLSNLVHRSNERVSALEANQERIEGTLALHGEQRKVMNQQMNDKLDKLFELVHNLKVETDDNSDFISKVQRYKVRIGFTLAGVLSTIGAIYWIYIFLQKHGLVIVFEKGVGG